MSPILGITSSQIQGHLAVAVPNSYESITTTTLGSNQTTVTLSSIPNTYTHLQVRLIGRQTYSSGPISCIMRINGDTGSNYTIHYVAGDGASAYTDYNSAFSQPYLYTLPGNGSGAGMFGAVILDILDYTNTNKYKTVKSFSGLDLNGSGQIRLNSSVWMSTSAVTSLSFSVYNGIGNMMTNSQFALYGIKGS